MMPPEGYNIYAAYIECFDISNHGADYAHWATRQVMLM